MKPFRFRLSRFLRLHEAEQRQLAIALAQENHALEAEQEVLDQRIGQKGQIERSYAGLAGRQVSVTDWAAADNALNSAKTRVRKQQQSVKKAETRVDQAREVLAHKSSEVETLRRLRERKRREYDVQFRRDEQKQIDEKAVERFAQSHQAAAARSGKNLPNQAGNQGPQHRHS